MNLPLEWFPDERRTDGATAKDRLTDLSMQCVYVVDSPSPAPLPSSSAPPLSPLFLPAFCRARLFHLGPSEPYSDLVQQNVGVAVMRAGYDGIVLSLTDPQKDGIEMDDVGSLHEPLQLNKAHKLRMEQ